MKIYPVKKNPHLDYLTSQQEQTPCGKVVYCDVGEEDGWMHRIIVDERRKVWVRWVQVG